jgi:hypothetical protein
MLLTPASGARYAFVQMEIGEKTVRRVEVQVCKKCGGEIEYGLCTVTCPLDGDDERPPDFTIIRVFERTDVFLEERYPSVLQKGYNMQPPVKY